MFIVLYLKILNTTYQLIYNIHTLYFKFKISSLKLKVFFKLGHTILIGSVFGVWPPYRFIFKLLSLKS